jgi:hypothetical protein
VFRESFDDLTVQRRQLATLGFEYGLTRRAR